VSGKFLEGLNTDEQLGPLDCHYKFLLRIYFASFDVEFPQELQATDEHPH
jgi:hypothetical protein